MADRASDGEGSISHEQIYAELTGVRRESSETRRLLADHARKAAAARSATNKRLERDEERFSALAQKLDALLADVRAVKGDTSTTKEMVNAWTTVKTMGLFLRWAAGIAAAITGLFVVIKSGASSFWASGS